jgi:acyl carrier protein
MSPSMPDPTVKLSYTAEAIQAWLVSRICEQLKVEPEEVDVREPFESYGLDSNQVMVIASQTEKKLGFKLSPILLWHYPTIESLSQRLAEESESSESEMFEV